MTIMDPASTSFPSPHPMHQHGPHPHQHPHLAHHQPPPPPTQQSQHFPISTLPSHAAINGLAVLDAPDPSVFHPHQHQHPHAAHIQRLQEVSTVPIVQDANGFSAHSHPQLQQQDSFDSDQQTPSHLHHHSVPNLHQRQQTPHQTPHQHHHQLDAPPAPPPPAPPHSAPPSHGQFSILTPNAVQSNTIAQLQQEEDFLAQPAAASSTSETAEQHPERPHGQLINKIVVDPPDLDAWRQKLFNVDDTIILTNDEFETYFPHIDNVYSHRSTQKYKRKPFVSHYWDCRMKGRPPGTPKSDDPSKKKRKRNARERDLCDVKIKITEYFAGATLQLDDANGNPVQPGAYPSPQQQAYSSDRFGGQPGANGEKFWTIQRVNGNGGNGKGDGVAGPHKHSLEKSDEIKKSTVQRFINAQEKEAKKTLKPFQRKPSGPAQSTAKKHAKDHELKLYAACFCPFSQRVWIALEVKGTQYQYCETDPFKRPTQLLEANPRGLVPAIREGEWASGESSIILEYLEDHDHRVPLFPTDPRLKANCRLWIDHINAKIVPSYFALLRAADVTKQTECIEKLQADITALVQAADERGPYFLGGDLCLVDIHFAPFVLRLSRMLSELRSWSDPMPGTRWHQWVEALEQNPHVQATTSTKDLYLETFDLFLKS
ncbi:uncharacterized protein BCR38DRAFT_438112 [Pseudomassariella vexata]|uniref:GST N-terminal domain-containing protein n=1 Tax=Pseudomassariella vexata TaxID=1141098 RepID=A0A1Y2DUI7_9PEZI|nr:uncharacterized protein BCR38DRAFT_438112 [Pseudomassariella vexata]ORY62305.1 hypothetical protein BCR38DRAFT_438112 [Pseudomassariella vexata]